MITIVDGALLFLLLYSNLQIIYCIAVARACGISTAIYPPGDGPHLFLQKTGTSTGAGKGHIFGFVLLLSAVQLSHTYTDTELTQLTQLTQ
jgi:hypothetical protein